MPRYKKNQEGGNMYENVLPSEPRADAVPLEQIEATVEEAGQYRQEDCRMYEDISTTEPGADSVPQDQITPEAVPSDQIRATVEEPGQYEQLDIGQNKEAYEDVKIYQRLKVL